MAKGKKTKDDLGKELIQCMAFAHFAVQKYRASNSDAHMESFYKLFDPNEKPNNSIINEYTQYLGEKFDFDRLYANWGKKEGSKDVKIVYDVAKKFYLSNNISKNFSQYEFLDQKDSFMITIKDKALDKIILALKLPFKRDILSSADIYIVKKQSKKNIRKEFEDEIINKNTLYLINNFDMYNKLLIKYWKSHDLFGVSLKLPSVISANKNIKIVGAEEDILNKKMQKQLDPYTKFISLLSDKNTNIRQLIDDTIEIRSRNLKNASWDFNFRFNYKKLGLYPTDVDFVLKSWTKAQTAGGGAAGFNGGFDKSVPGYSDQWVGGTGIETLQTFLFKYSEYNRIMAELCNIRQKALNYTLTGSANTRPNINQPLDDSKVEISFSTTPKEAKYNKENKLVKFIKKKGERNGITYKTDKTGEMKVKNMQSFYTSALREIKSKNFNLGVNKNKNLDKFFTEYEKANNIAEGELWRRYKMAVTNLATKTSIGKKIDQSDSMLNSFYEHSQISYFMLRGGQDFLKRKIFMTIFGVITKKGYHIIKDSDLTSSRLEGAIRAIASKKLLREIKQFDTVPHFYMS